MKSKYQKNIKRTSSEPQFEIGDLVRHKYPDMSANPNDVGLIIEIYSDMSYGADEENFASFIYGYLIEWIKQGDRTYLYELFLEKHVPQK